MMRLSSEWKQSLVDLAVLLLVASIAAAAAYYLVGCAPYRTACRSVDIPCDADNCGKAPK